MLSNTSCNFWIGAPGHEKITKGHKLFRELEGWTEDKILDPSFCGFGAVPEEFPKGVENPSELKNEETGFPVGNGTRVPGAIAAWSYSSKEL